jgi:flagellar biosynthesis GTPase FlhF
MKQANQLKRLDEEGRRVEEEDTKSESLVDCMQTHCSVGDKLDENENCIIEESVDDVGNQSVQYWNSTMSISHREFYHHEISIDMDCATETPPPDEMENDDQLNNQRIAEFFADEKNRCAELIKKGQPNVYLLNATDTSASEDLRWFDVGRPVRSPPTCMKNHKLIILMGATGCGKSTLINGMVNYILGVKWNDPFRFKCVREDETTARNQAISQTSSVTAYTIRHRNGMAVHHDH